MIMGIDISTSIVGITLLDGNGSVIQYGHVDLRKTKDFYDMCDSVKVTLQSFPEPELVFVEEPVMSFSKKGSSASTIAVLQAFNGAIRLLVHEMWKKPIQSVSATHARKKLNIDTKVDKKLSSYHRKKALKGKIISWVIAEGADLGFTKTKKDNYVVGCDDRADSYVMARFGLLS